MVISATQLFANPSHPLQLASLERQIRACQYGTCSQRMRRRILGHQANRDIYRLPWRRYVCLPDLDPPFEGILTSSALVPIHSYARKRRFSFPSTVDP
ncbi:hypothetical protein LZ31DRAFT_145586 [Colletotrichum somersetense]|nr:hypothetical protein LZ31DRAFT_145586 [Colletotrichum somersetense]